MNETEPQRQLNAALGRIASGLFVLTVRQGNAETGMLASWVQQCSFEPPQISVAIRKNRPVLTWLTSGALFTINILDDSETDMIVHFGRGFELNEPAFVGVEVERSQDNPPIIKDALAFLECEVVGRCSAGDHALSIGRVLAGRMLDEGNPMVHIRKSGAHY